MRKFFFITIISLFLPSCGPIIGTVGMVSLGAASKEKGIGTSINDNLIKNNKCICLHPSPLPKYRGGSPIQHQIINGESLSAVTFFEMTDKLDAGNILYKEYFSLKGDLKDIFLRISNLGISGILRILHSNIIKETQDESKATFYKRRKPKESEIFIDDFIKYTAKELHNKIRSLQDPYPNAYIQCKDGSKLYITKTKNND